MCVFRGLWQRSTGREPCSSDIKRAIRLPEGPFIVPPHSTAAPLTHHLLPPASLVLISVSECGRTTEARKIKRHCSKFVCICSSFTTQVPLFIQPNTHELFELHLPSKYSLCQYHTVCFTTWQTTCFAAHTMKKLYLMCLILLVWKILRKTAIVCNLWSNEISLPHVVYHHFYLCCEQKYESYGKYFFFLWLFL